MKRLYTVSVNASSLLLHGAVLRFACIAATRRMSSATSTVRDSSHCNDAAMEPSAPTASPLNHGGAREWSFDLSALPPTLRDQFDVDASRRMLQHLAPNATAARIRTVSTTSRWLVAWKCDSCRDSFTARVCDRVQHPDLGCPCCGKHNEMSDTSGGSPQIVSGTSTTSNRTLLQCYPELAADWDVLRNERMPLKRLPPLEALLVDSDVACWWQCRDCKVPWREAVFSRVDAWRVRLGRQQKHAPPPQPCCPYCEELRMPLALKVSREYLTDHRLLMLEVRLTPDKPSPAAMRLTDANKLTWECCACACVYDAPLHNRAVRGARCPLCSGKRASPFNALTTQRPDVVQEVAAGAASPSLMEKLTVSSNKRLTFVCRTCMEVYTMTVQQRCSVPPGATACPKCRHSALTAIANHHHDSSGPVKQITLADRYKRRSYATMSATRWKLESRSREPTLLN